MIFMLTGSDTRRETLARQLRTVGDDCRLHILCILIAHKKAFVSEIAAQTDCSIAIISHHLQVLLQENIVTKERVGKKVYYALSKDSFVTDIKRHICKYQ